MGIPKDVIKVVEKSPWPEDIKQEFYVWWLEAPSHDFGSVEQLSAYCNKSMRNLLGNERYKAMNRRRLEEENKAKILDELGFGGTDAFHESSEDILIAEEEMRQRLDGLSPLLRTTLEAVVLKGRTPEQLAAEQGTTPNVIYKRVFDAKQILQGNN